MPLHPSLIRLRAPHQRQLINQRMDLLQRLWWRMQ
jgi:hypothetical protein